MFKSIFKNIAWMVLCFLLSIVTINGCFRLLDYNRGRKEIDAIWYEKIARQRAANEITQEEFAEVFADEIITKNEFDYLEDLVEQREAEKKEKEEQMQRQAAKNRLKDTP